MSENNPSPALPFTGERFTPECVREIWYEHWHRYALAATLAEGRRVVDVACGEGYGSALLAECAESVVGIDIDPQTVRHARGRYGGHRNLVFEVGDCADIPLDDDSADLVVSFETLEHIEPQRRMLAECRRILKPDGVLVISTPDRSVYSEVMGADNEFHVRELERGEFISLLGEQFPALRVLGQKLLFVSAIWDEARGGGPWGVSEAAPQAATPGLTASAGTEGEASPMPWRPVYHVALCAAADNLLPATPTLHLFGDRKESVYRHYNEEVGKSIQAGLIIQERDRTIAELKAELGHKSPARVPWWRRLFGRGKD